MLTIHSIPKDDDEGTNERWKGTDLIMMGDCFWGVCACDSARELEPEGGLSSNQPAFQATADQPTNQEEARKPSGCQSSPSRRAVEMRAPVFRESRRQLTSCIIFSLSSHHLPLIGSRRYASSRDRRCTRFFTATAAAAAAAPEAVVRTWVFIPGLVFSSVALEQSRGRDRDREATVEPEDKVDHLGVTTCRLSPLSCRRRSPRFNFVRIFREIMAPDSCDRVRPVTSQKSSGEENRLRGTFGTAVFNS